MTSELTRRAFLHSAAAAVALPQAPSRRPNLLLIMCDQLRADSVACYGNPVVRTPAPDGLAAQGVRFRNHFVQAPQCVPSRVTLHTGRYPHIHRTPSNSFVLPETERTLASCLNDAGYTTAAIGERPFAPRRYLGGFRTVVTDPDYDRFLEQHGWRGPVVTAERGTLLARHKALSDAQFQAAPVPWPEELDETTFFANEARRFIREYRDRPFFLHVNFRRPHHPFDPPPPYDTMYQGARFPVSHKRDGEMANKPPGQQKALESSVGFDLRRMTAADLDRVKAFYYGMITLADKQIGNILGELRSAAIEQDTVVVFTSDHGEMLGDHGLLFKGGYMYDEVLHVPLIVRAPGHAAGEVAALTEHVDIAPTVLKLLGVDIPAAVQGRPLIGAPGRQRDAVFSEFPAIKCVRTRDWKLVHYPRQKYGELYDLRNDPNELTNLYGDPAHAAARNQMQARLADWLIESSDPLLAPVRTTDGPP